MFSSVPDVIDGIYSTRIFILSFIIGVFILVFYSSLSTHIRINTVYQPSMNEYEQLYKRYSSMLTCPCTRLSIPYSSIIYMKPYYHQVCSSDCVKDDKWLLYSLGIYANINGRDFRVRASTIFTMLQKLCVLSTELVANKPADFNNLQFITPRLIPKYIFDMQTSELMQQFHKQVFDKKNILFILLIIN
ncbi:unnamed protein product [Rotaria sp. Silwood1]|nr:unnamed protein product [Rotaria sp. Silwood1]